MPQDLSHLSPEERARYEAYRARMTAAFSFERVETPGASALSTWERLQAATGHRPVVIGGDDDLERLMDQFTMLDPAVSGYSGGPALRTTEAILTAAGSLRFPEDMPRWLGAYRPEDLRAPVGNWPPDTGPATTLTVAADQSSGQMLDRIWVLSIPARENCEIPAHLRWGGWNACPPPEYHVAALRSWNRRYGAELVGINGDTMNVRVAHRPTSRDEALALARELYQYCPDIVDQGTGTLSALAAELMASDWWFFWWD